MNNPVTGLLFLVGLAINSSAAYTALGVLGLVLGTTASIVLSASPAARQSGLYGYNGLLVGHAIATLMHDVSQSDPSLPSVLYAAIAVAAIAPLSTLLTLACGQLLVPVYRVPPFTLPFNLTTMAYLACAGLGRNFLVARGLQPSLVERQDPSDADVSYLDGWNDEGYFADVGELVLAVLRGYSQVFLSDDALAGGFIAVGESIPPRSLDMSHGHRLRIAL